MPKKSKEKEAELRRTIRDAIAIDPLITTQKLRQYLYKKGYKTANGNELHWEYVAKLVKKVRKDAIEKMNRVDLSERIAQTKERYRIVFERLARIAFYSKEMMELGMPPPEYSDQIRALETIVKLDLAILNAEMDAGIFERALGTMKIEHTLPEEEKKKIRNVFEKWGLLDTTPKEPIRAYVTDVSNTNTKKGPSDEAKRLVAGFIRPQSSTGQGT